MTKFFYRWLLNNVPLGPLAPWVLGLMLKRMPRRKP
jgi:hypothetical protein